MFLSSENKDTGILIYLYKYPEIFSEKSRISGQVCPNRMGGPMRYVPMAREENAFKNSRHPDSYRDGELNPH
jgi:hypothetical protein